MMIFHELLMLSLLLSLLNLTRLLLSRLRHHTHVHYSIMVLSSVLIQLRFYFAGNVFKSCFGDGFCGLWFADKIVLLDEVLAISTVLDGNTQGSTGSSFAETQGFLLVFGLLDLTVSRFLSFFDVLRSILFVFDRRLLRRNTHIVFEVHGRNYVLIEFLSGPLCLCKLLFERQG